MRFLEMTPPEQVRPVRLLTGDDLQAMGFHPGPLFAEILRSLEDAQLDGQIRKREEAVEYVRKSFPLKERKGSSD
jgi:hypothetical protein